MTKAAADLEVSQEVSTFLRSLTLSAEPEKVAAAAERYLEEIRRTRALKVKVRQEAGQPAEVQG